MSLGVSDVALTGISGWANFRAKEPDITEPVDLRTVENLEGFTKKGATVLSNLDFSSEETSEKNISQLAARLKSSKTERR